MFCRSRPLGTMLTSELVVVWSRLERGLYHRNIISRRYRCCSSLILVSVNNIKLRGERLEKVSTITS